jgi:hypothetical protein
MGVDALLSRSHRRLVHTEEDARFLDELTPVHAELVLRAGIDPILRTRRFHLEAA